MAEYGEVKAWADETAPARTAPKIPAFIFMATSDCLGEGDDAFPTEPYRLSPG